MPNRILALLALTFLLAGTLLLPASEADAQPSQESAADKYVACLNGSKSGDVLVLVDTSASLQASDAENARIRAAEYLLRRLAKSADDGQLELNVALAGFDNRFTPPAQWDRLNPGSVNKVVSDMGTFAQRNSGNGTDYWLGLDGARAALADRKKANPSSCQATVFFSDGQLDIDRAPDEADKPIGRPYAPDNPLRNDGDRKAAKEAAAADMCRPGGLADQLRVAPVTLFGIGLTSGEAGAADFDLMKNVVQGGGGCGQQPPNGQFTLADDIDSLLQAFDKVAGEGREHEGAYCRDENIQQCEAGAHSFVLDQSIDSVSVLGTGDVEDPRIVLLAPNGKEVELKPGVLGVEQKLDVDGVGVTYSWLSHKSFSATIDQNSAPSWTGRWRLVFFDTQGTNPQAKSHTTIHISGNLFPAWPGGADAQVRAGEKSEATFGLADAGGKPVDANELLGTASMDATLVGPDGTETPIAKGLDKAAIGRPQPLDATRLEPGPATVRLNLAVTTASWTDPRTGEVVPGTELRPQLADIPVTVLPPPGFGQVGNDVDFGQVEGPITLDAGLPVTGPACVWVDGETPATITTGPREVTGVRLTSTASSQDSCVKVEDGQSGTLPLNLASDQQGTGSLTGNFTVKMASLDSPDKVQQTEVGYRANVAVPLNKTNAALAFIVALILGPGIPIGLLYATKFAGAKIPGRPLLVQQIPVQLQGTQLLRDGAPLAWREGDLTSMASIAGKGQRSLDVGGTTLQARTGGSPFGAGHVLVEAGNQVGASSAYDRPVGKQHRAKLPLAVHDNWVLLHDPAGPADRATAVLLVPGEATVAKREELLEDLGRRGPQVMGHLKEFNTAGPGTDGPAQPDNPFGGGPATGGGQGGSPFAGGPGAPQQPFPSGQQSSGQQGSGQQASGQQGVWGGGQGGDPVDRTQPRPAQPSDPFGHQDRAPGEAGQHQPDRAREQWPPQSPQQPGQQGGGQAPPQNPFNFG